MNNRVKNTELLSAIRERYGLSVSDMLGIARIISREFGLSLNDILCDDEHPHNNAEAPDHPSISEGKDTYGLWMALRYRGVRQCFRWIEPGEFLMGSPEREGGRDDDETQHKVTFTQGFWLADTACTQALWKAVIGDNPSNFKGEDRPVENVSWNDVQRFIERLNELAPSGGFRLPTEAEWEYACRAGTKTAFWFGDQITPKQVNYDGDDPDARRQKGKYRGKTVAVKALPCNSWGLYQMHGNVWEWCHDWYGAYPTSTVVDPRGPAHGVWRVQRGGCWANFGRDVRSAYRYHGDPGDRNASIGFRIAM